MTYNFAGDMTFYASLPRMQVAIGAGGGDYDVPALYSTVDSLCTYLPTTDSCYEPLCASERYLETFHHADGSDTFLGTYTYTRIGWDVSIHCGKLMHWYLILSSFHHPGVFHGSQ